MKTQKDDSVKDQTATCDNNMLSVAFSFNEKVVWDSHFGYEIGYFLGEGWVYNTYLIDVRTGIIAEECCHSKSEVHKYSDKLIEELTKKYGYEKRFSDIF